MGTDLKKCPFCGGKAALVKRKKYLYANTYNIICTECGNETGNYMDKNLAIERWNTRTPVDDILKKLEGLKGDYIKPVAANVNSVSITNMLVEIMNSKIDEVIEIVKECNYDGRNFDK